jgi:hypothetical protein
MRYPEGELKFLAGFANIRDVRRFFYASNLSGVASFLTPHTKRSRRKVKEIPGTSHRRQVKVFREKFYGMPGFCSMSFTWQPRRS